MGLPGVSGLERRSLFSVSGYGGKPSARRKAMREFRIPAGTVRLKKVGSHGGIRLLILGDQHLSFNK